MRVAGGGVAVGRQQRRGCARDQLPEFLRTVIVQVNGQNFAPELRTQSCVLASVACE